ncbi:PIN domain-containing protein [Candidatus Amesbacteria bacterium]|nr:PIN domain-containing protein [Candidatus Amesbacteria bacterium]
MIKLPVFIDTSPCVYLIEKNPDFGPLCIKIFDFIQQSDQPSFTSIITAHECFVKPLKLQDRRLLTAYEVLFIQTPNIQLVSPIYHTAFTAAQIRAAYHFSPSDSFQLALAQENRCQTFLTNDRQLTQFKNLKITCLSDLVTS